jgi:hypothetical protein
MARYQLYSRQGCGLCDEMFEELLSLGISQDAIELIDIDQRPELRALYGNKIPVLEAQGGELASGRLSDESRRAVRP